MVEAYFQRRWRAILKVALVTFLVTEMIMFAVSASVVTLVMGRQVTAGLLLDLAGLVTPIASLAVLGVAGIQFNRAIHYMPIILMDEALTRVRREFPIEIPIRNLVERMGDRIRRTGARAPVPDE